MTKELEAAMLKVETFLDRTKLVSSSPTDGEIAAIEMLVTALATPAEPVGYVVPVELGNPDDWHIEAKDETGEFIVYTGKFEHPSSHAR
jgi:RPA family protein